MIFCSLPVSASASVKARPRIGAVRTSEKNDAVTSMPGRLLRSFVENHRASRGAKHRLVLDGRHAARSIEEGPRVRQSS